MTPHEPTAGTRAAVAILAAYGLPESVIAQHLGASRSKLRQHYPLQLTIGRGYGNRLAAARLAAALGSRPPPIDPAESDVLEGGGRFIGSLLKHLLT